jgi:Amt family ammonium transporter
LVAAVGFLVAFSVVTPLAFGDDKAAATPVPPVASPAPAAAASKEAAPAATPAPAPENASQPAPAPAKTDTADSTGTLLTTDKINGGNSGTALDLTWPTPADSPTVNPTGKGKVTTDEVVENVAHNKISINIVWTLVGGFLVMFMQLGFALLETGLCRAKNAVHTFGMNILIYGVGVLGFWAVGYAIMFGGYGIAPSAIGSQPSLGQGLLLLNGEHYLSLFGKSFGLWGTKGYFLNPSVFDSAVFCLFLFEMVFMDTAATIPTGALAERWNFKSFFIYGFFVSMVAYPLFGNWVWGGGWLAQLGQNFGLGHGHVDFAGSSVVHECGGVIALVGAAVLGPRIGKFTKSGKPMPIPAHDIPLVVAGTLILAFGWFGFNPGSTLAGTDHRIAIIAVNTMLASAAGMVTAVIIMWNLFGKPDITMACNGMLAGLVAITAPCAFVSSLGAVIIGAISGILVVCGVFFVERVLRVDDPVGAVAVHCINGFFGVVAVGLFANGSYGQGWNGVHKLIKGDAIQTLSAAAPDAVAQLAKLTGDGWADQGVTGLFGKFFGAAYNDGGQLTAEFTGAVTCFVFVGALAFVWFKLTNFFVPLRSKREDEIQGLDVPEMGAEAYPDFQTNRHSTPTFD